MASKAATAVRGLRKYFTRGRLRGWALTARGRGGGAWAGRRTTDGARPARPKPGAGRGPPRWAGAWGGGGGGAGRAPPAAGEFPGSNDLLVPTAGACGGGGPVAIGVHA